MKKRVLAALLALVMLFGALPMSVFAEDLETGDEFSDTYEPDEPEKYTYHLYYDFNYVGDGSTKWNIEYGPTADTSYTYTVDRKTLTCREGYNFLGWADSKTATKPDYRGGDTITLTWDNPTKTIYAVWEEQPQPDITDPKDFAKTLSVFVQCKDNKNHYVTKQLEYLTNGEWAVEWTRGSKEATLKLYPAKIAPLYTVGGEHKAVDESTVTVTLAYTNRWSIAGAIPAIPTIKITCAAPEIPDPTEFIGIKTVPVQCNNKADHYMQYAIDGLIERKCAELVWSTGSKEATLKLYPEKIANRFSALKGTHTAVSTSVVTVTLTYNGSWKIDGAIPVIYVTCAAPEIPDPTDSVKEQYVTVACDNQTAHPNIQYQLKNLPAGSVDVQWDRTATTAKLVLKPEKIAEHYGKSYGAHTAVNPADVVVPLTYANDAWSLSAAIPEVHVTCKPTYLTLTYDANAPAGKTVTNLPAPQTESLPEGSSVVKFQLSEKIPVCEGYEFLGWTTDTSSSIATFPVEDLGTDSWVSTTGNPNYILYALWKEAEVIPEPKEIVGTSNVKVFCLNPAAGQPNCNKIEYGVSLAFKRSLTKDETNEKHYTLELNAETYANAYTGNRGKGNESVAHNLYSSDTLTWDLRYEGGKWNAYPRETGVDDVVLVTHAPQKWEEVGQITAGTGVDTTCVTSGKYAKYGLTTAFLHYNTDVTTTYDKATKSYVSVIKPDTYISAIEKGCNGLTGETRAHKLTTKEALTWIFSVESVNGTTASWKAVPQTEADRKVTVKCLEDLNVFVVPADSDGEPLTETSHSALSAATLDRIGFHAYDKGMDALLAGSFQSNAAIQAEPDVDAVAEELLENGTFQIAPANNKTNFEKNNILEKTDWTYVEPDENYMLGVLTLYSVKFETEDAENVTGVPADDYYLLTEEFKLPNPTRPGFKFLGWKADADTPVIYSDPTTDAGSLLQAGANYRVLNNVTFTAVWEPVEYTITYNWRGVVKPADVKNVNNPETFTADDLPITLKAPDFKNNEWPQKFLNWRDAAGNVVTQITESGNVELYAYYQFPVRYTVYDENGQKVDNLSVTDWYNEDDFADYNLKSGEQTGHDFDGWYQTTKDFGNTNKRVTKLNMAKKYELVGKLTRKEYTVTASLFLNGSEEATKDARGVVISRSVKGLYGDLIDYPELEKQLKEAALAADAANKPNPDMADINICLNDKSGKPFDAATYGQEGYNWRNMQWPENNPTKKWIVAYAWAYVDTYYDVTFNVDMEGVTPVATQTVKCNATANEPTAPTKEGYKFLGWFKDGETTAFDFTTPITKSMTLTAKWERNTYTIIYHGNGGVKVKGDKTYEQLTSAKLPIGEPTTLKSAEFTRDNYAFLGWSYFENGSVYFKAAEKNVLFEESDIDENGNVHLYAIWKRLSYPVTLRYNANTTDENTCWSCECGQRDH